MIRLNKFLSTQGYASRRGADTLIAERKVLVNGLVATVGMQIDAENDHIEVCSEALQQKESEKVYYLLNKPEGYITATKKTIPEDKTVMDLFPSKDFPRIYPVGRLDKDSCGLIMLTNDGDLTYELMHPKFEHEKEYWVEIFNPITPEMLRRMKEPFYMLGQKTKSAKVQKVSDYAFHIVLEEGKNRQIRRMIRSIGSGVRTLRRIRIGKIILSEHLKEGEWMQITKEQAYQGLE